MYGYIYLITDTVTGKQYVGQHKHSRYFEIDKYYNGSGIIIKNLSEKRKESLKMEYLMPVECVEEANFFEEYWIYKLNTLYPNGYNLNTGGNHWELSEEAKRKDSDKIKEKWNDEEYRNKIIESHKGKEPWNKGTVGVCKANSTSFKKGRVPSEEERRKKSESMINGKKSKSVIQYTIKGEFVKEWPSAKEVERQLGFRAGKIRSCRCGIIKTAYGYIWKYKHNEDNTENYGEEMD